MLSWGHCKNCVFIFQSALDFDLKEKKFYTFIWYTFAYLKTVCCLIIKNIETTHKNDLIYSNLNKIETLATLSFIMESKKVDQVKKKQTKKQKNKKTPYYLRNIVDDDNVGPSCCEVEITFIILSSELTK